MSRFQRMVFYINRKIFALRDRLLRFFIEGNVRIRGESFKCRALTGESNYNICINADMSVSCNCNDILGDGQLGNLRQNSFEEIFTGTKANKMRRILMKGRLPIANCRSCPELMKVSKKISYDSSKNYSLPKHGIMMENTAACNLSCLGCWRTLRPLKRLKMSLDDIRIVANTLKDMSCEKLAFFSLGEPFISQNILQELTIIRSLIPEIVIHTSTNGVMIDSDEKREATMHLDCITISLDGCSQEIAEKYQVGIDFNKAYENMCNLIKYRDKHYLEKGPLIIWKYVVFNWNDHPEYVEKILSLAQQARVDMLQFTGTSNPIHGISWRYKLAPYWRKLASLENNIRVVFLRDVKEQYYAIWN